MDDRTEADTGSDSLPLRGFKITMFLVDKHGDTVFFPWGSRSKRGYVVNDPDLQMKISKFFTISIVIYIVIAILLFIAFHDLESAVIVIAWTAGCLLVHHLYINRISESLPISKTRYADILLDQMYPDDEERENKIQPLSPHPALVDQSKSKPLKDPLRAVRLILHPLPSGLWAAILWVTGVAIAVIWNTFHPALYSGPRAEDLTIFFIIFFIGLGFLIYGVKGESLPGKSSNPWIAVILSLGLSLLFLYGFIAGK